MDAFGVPFGQNNGLGHKFILRQVPLRPLAYMADTLLGEESRAQTSATSSTVEPEAVEATAASSSAVAAAVTSSCAEAPEPFAVDADDRQNVEAVTMAYQGIVRSIKEVATRAGKSRVSIHVALEHMLFCVELWW